MNSDETFDLLRVKMTLDGEGRLSAVALGSLASMAQPFLDYLVSVLNSLKIIARKNGRNIYNLYNPPQPSRAGLRALERKLKEKLFGYVFPATGNISVTDRCQCNCAHCSAGRFNDPRRRELTTEELKSVVDQTLALGSNLIIFVGGEPLMRPDIYELISHVDRDKAVTSIFTNGLALDEATVRRLADAGLDNLYVSIDSPEAAEHDALRGVDGLFERAVEGALLAKKHGILIGLSTYATHRRVADGAVEALVEFARDKGFHEVTIFDCIPSGRFLRNTDCILSEQEKSRLVELQNRYHRSDHPMGVIAQAWVNSPRGAGCFGAFSQFYMTSYGDVCPCDFNPISFGNVLEEPLEKIWFRMTHHPDFSYRHATCRMQTPAYRAKYIDTIGDDEILPVRIDRFSNVPPLPRAELKKRVDPVTETLGG